MRIVCMDCQTESYVDVEMLKDQKRIDCNHCAENLPLTSSINTVKPPSPDNSASYSGFGQEIPAEKGFSLLEDDDILELSDYPSIYENGVLLDTEEVISLP